MAADSATKLTLGAPRPRRHRSRAAGAVLTPRPRTVCQADGEAHR